MEINCERAFDDSQLYRWKSKITHTENVSTINLLRSAQWELGHVEKSYTPPRLI